MAEHPKSPLILHIPAAPADGGHLLRVTAHLVVGDGLGGVTVISLNLLRKTESAAKLRSTELRAPGTSSVSVSSYTDYLS